MLRPLVEQPSAPLVPAPALRDPRLDRLPQGQPLPGRALLEPLGLEQEPQALPDLLRAVSARRGRWRLEPPSPSLR